jgi:hypothetical protein
VAQEPRIGVGKYLTFVLDNVPLDPGGGRGGGVVAGLDEAGVASLREAAEGAEADLAGARLELAAAAAVVEASEAGPCGLSLPRHTLQFKPSCIV